MIHLSVGEMKSGLDFEDFGHANTVHLECLVTAKSCSSCHVCRSRRNSLSLCQIHNFLVGIKGIKGNFSGIQHIQTHAVGQEKFL